MHNSILVTLEDDHNEAAAREVCRVITGIRGVLSACPGTPVGYEATVAGAVARAETLTALRMVVTMLADERRRPALEKFLAGEFSV